MSSFKLVVLLAVTGLNTKITADICDDHIPPWIPGPKRGCVLPDNPYVYIGHNLTLDCHLSNSNPNSADLGFTWKNDQNISRDYQRVTSPSTLHLDMPIMESDNITSHGVLVLCNDWSSGHLIGSGQFLHVEYYPREVSDWQAVVDNWKNLSVTWNTGHYINIESVSVAVQWRSSDNEVWASCSSDTRTSCFLENSIYTHGLQYHLNVTVTNTKKNNSTYTLYTLDSENYVKPAPVTLSRVNVSSRCVMLTWKHEMVANRSLIYKVVALNGDREEINRTYHNSSVRVCGLHPDTLYTYSVSARSALGGFWSDTVSASKSTKEDRPDAGVNVTAGGFHTTECKNSHRNVTIFLKPPSAQHRNGKLLQNTIMYTLADGKTKVTEVHNVTAGPTFSTSLACDVDYTMYISVNNSAGASPVSELHIPEVRRRSSSLKYVRVAVNISSVEVVWQTVSDSNPQNFTVYWCKGSSYFRYCQSSPMWLIVDRSRRSVTVPVSVESVSAYLFAVSMATDDWSSGMKMSDCLYDVHKALDPDSKPIIQDVSSKPNLGLTVKWSLPVCDQHVLTSHYVVQHCQDGNSNHCVNTTITSDHNQHVIHGLEDGHSYAVRLRQIAVSGQGGQFSDPAIGVPIDVYLKPGEIAAIACSSIVILGVAAGLMLCLKRKCKEREKIIIPATKYNQDGGTPPPLPDRQTDLHTIETSNQQRASTDSGQGSRETEMTSPLNSTGQDSPRDLSGQQCSEGLASGQTMMTDISCSSTVVSLDLSNTSGVNSDHLDSGEDLIYKDHSDVCPYVTAGELSEKQGVCVNPRQVCETGNYTSLAQVSILGKGAASDTQIPQQFTLT